MIKYKPKDNVNSIKNIWSKMVKFLNEQKFRNKYNC